MVLVCPRCQNRMVVRDQLDDGRSCLAFGWVDYQPIPVAVAWAEADQLPAHCDRSVTTEPPACQASPLDDADALPRAGECAIPSSAERSSTPSLTVGSSPVRVELPSSTVRAISAGIAPSPPGPSAAPSFARSCRASTVRGSCMSSANGPSGPARTVCWPWPGRTRGADACAAESPLGSPRPARRPG